MFHGAILGMSGSGKTFLARNLASGYKGAGRNVLSLHKPDEPWKQNEVTIQTSHVDLFLDKIEEIREENEILIESGMEAMCKSWVCFIELSDAEADKNDKRLHLLFSKGRHNGLKLYYLSQRGQSVHPNIRENCSELFLFSCYMKAAKNWSEEFCDDELLKAAKLPKYEFYHKKDRFTPAQLRKLAVG